MAAGFEQMSEFPGHFAAVEIGGPALRFHPAGVVLAEIQAAFPGAGMEQIAAFGGPVETIERAARVRHVQKDAPTDSVRAAADEVTSTGRGAAAGCLAGAAVRRVRKW